MYSARENTSAALLGRWTPSFNNELALRLNKTTGAISQMDFDALVYLHAQHIAA